MLVIGSHINNNVFERMCLGLIHLFLVVLCWSFKRAKNLFLFVDRLPSTQLFLQRSIGASLIFFFATKSGNRKRAIHSTCTTQKSEEALHRNRKFPFLLADFFDTIVFFYNQYNGRSRP